MLARVFLSWSEAAIARNGDTMGAGWDWKIVYERPETRVLAFQVCGSLAVIVPADVLCVIYLLV